MEKIKLKIVLFLLVLILVSCENNSAENDFEYTVENSKATITKYTGSAENLIIPKELGGYAVTSIGEKAFAYCYSLTMIEIPDSVTSEAV